MKKFYCFLIFLLFSIWAHAQSIILISGVVEDRETGEPLPGTAISIADQGAVTDIDGRFNFGISEAAFPCKMTVAVEGYRTQQIELTKPKDNPNMKIGMEISNVHISGVVFDKETGMTLPGAFVRVLGAHMIYQSDVAGKFSFYGEMAVPCTLQVSFVGYETQQIIISADADNLKILMETSTMLETVTVSAPSRQKQMLLTSPVAAEVLQARDLQQLPAADFYEGLAQLKGVDMMTQSLTFRSINTRGFASNGNIRFVQWVDGMDNQAPGLNFSVGNILGIPDIDLESAELLPGASSALYGANAINGILILNSKDPFKWQGADLLLKGGMMRIKGSERPADPLGEVQFRYANSMGRLGFKVNVSYLAAHDWQANDYRDRNNLSSNTTGAPNYDGVNVYGDETNFNMAIRSRQLVQQGVLSASDSGYFQQNNLINRTGYFEKELANYDTRNIKLNGALHYRIGRSVTAVLQGNYGSGTSLFTGGDRYSLVDFRAAQFKAELKGDRFFLRAYTTQERAGDTYALTVLGQRLNEAGKPTAVWSAEYMQAFVAARKSGKTETEAHALARAAADAGRLLPGSEAFAQAKDKILSLPAPQGARFIDKTNLYHYEGMYRFAQINKWVDLTAGASFRTYQLNSEGTLFADRDGRKLSINEFGTYVQAIKSLLEERLQLTAAMRFDKNENFAGQLTPRFAALYQLKTEKLFQTLRLSFQTGFRNPTVQNQYLDLDVIRARAVGGLPEFRNTYNMIQNPVYTIPVVAGYALSAAGTGKPDPSVLKPYAFSEFKPEKIQSLEAGYRLLGMKVLYIDAYYYYNFYRDFIRSQLLLQSRPADGAANPLGLLNNPQVYIVPVNESKQVTTQGAALSVNVKVYKEYAFSGSTNWNRFNTRLGEGELSEFNTPEWKFNLGFANARWFQTKNVQAGFNVTYRWQSSFRWESTFGNGDVPAYNTLDAQTNLGLRNIGTVLKLGATNLLNRYYRQSFGNPQVGALYYVQVVYQGRKKKTKAE